MANSRDALWATGHDETVEVNQRALIDKVLARYSGEFTVFRELLQNSDDAQSSAVEIYFNTQAFIDQGNISKENSKDKLFNLKTTPVHRWTFKNNGILFRDEDWNRLKKIAEGNPDEEKIGAFGVGFYSLFSVTEEPFVTSGDQWMGFYWKDQKDQLFARRGVFQQTDQLSSWTSFDMPLREAAPMPVAFDFARFLASSLTFMVHLSEVTVYFDNHKLVKLSKQGGAPQDLVIPISLTASSGLGLMNIKHVEVTPLTVKAEVMKWVYSSGTEMPPLPSALKPRATSTSFFSSLIASLSAPVTPQRIPTPLPVDMLVNEDLSIDETSVTLSIYTADVDVLLTKKVVDELLRSTKKQPPAKLRYALIYTAKDDYDASKAQDQLHSLAKDTIFKGLRADLEGTGSARIFIGHATAQTTGIGGHMSARFIPTVERESIDFMDRHVASWNRELLYVGGFLARFAYEREMDAIRKKWEGDTSDHINHELRFRLQQRAIHALKFFTFYQSTPSAEVSNLLEQAFYSCSNNAQFPLISTVGVRNATDVRLSEAVFSVFLKALPVVPTNVEAQAGPMVTSLRNQGLIKPISFNDVLGELQSHPLTEEETIACLKWWIDLLRTSEAPPQPVAARDRLVDAIIISTTKPNSSAGTIIPLSSIRRYINGGGPGVHIPLDGPLPNDLLPPTIGSHFSPVSLHSDFGWTELTILQWVEHICNPSIHSRDPKYDINHAALWAERVLNTLARVWDRLPDRVKLGITELLGDKTCIPTSLGMKAPNQAYFPNVNMFRDLPISTMPSGVQIKGPLLRVLQSLGVRRHVDLQVVFTRMITTGDWTIVDLTKYLTTLQADLSDEEWSRLKITPVFFKENPSPVAQGKLQRFRADQLYEPLNVFRQLGLPILDWGNQTKWRASSNEAKFLFRLGLIRYPPLNDLVDLCGGPDQSVRHTALKYLLDNLTTRYVDYDPTSFAGKTFIPALKGTTACLGTPTEVFSDNEWAELGFLVLHPSYQQEAAKLKIGRYPSSPMLVQLLRTTPPSDEKQARIWFSTMAGRISDFTPNELGLLSHTPFVPVKTGEKSSPMRLVPPNQCFLGNESTGGLHSRIFTFVDFGPAGNTFLNACASKHEPSVEEIALMLLDDPHRFYELAGGPRKLLNELRNIAVNSRLLSSGLIARMQRSPILLCSRRKTLSKERQDSSDDLEDEDWELEYDLKQPDEIAIVDDTNAHQLFGGSIFTAPQEDILEDFYMQLGSRRLSSLVKQEYRTSTEMKNSKRSTEIRSLVLERLPLFLHEHTNARTKVQYKWLSTGNNFTVQAYSQLSVSRILIYGGLRFSRSHDASAVAKRDGDGPVQLWIATNTEVDMYEIATSLCRIIFDTPKSSDALLFMTILSTDLKSLMRRGYNVNRILRQQDAERATVEAHAREKDMKLASAPQTPPKPRLSTGTETTISNAPHPQTGSTLKPRPGSTLLQSILHPRRRPGSPPTGRGSSPSRLSSDPDDTLVNTTSLSDGGTSVSTQSSDNTRVTPLSDIDKNILMAISTCRPEQRHLLRNREKMQQVRESLNEGYCDISGRAGDLNFVGEMGIVRVYVSKEEPDLRTFMSRKHDSLARFIHVMTPLAQLYNFPLSSLHIFYDLQGGLIAFNRNASLFLNLRFYEAWHDENVKHNNLNAAYISWYFTLAHEIAHNLVQPHNSEHEFYFSAICQRYIHGLFGLLSTA